MLCSFEGITKPSSLNEKLSNSDVTKLSLSDISIEAPLQYLKMKKLQAVAATVVSIYNQQRNVGFQLKIHQVRKY